MKHLLRHLLLPHHSNNHRAKLLHNDSLFILVLCLLFGYFLITSSNSHGAVLGASLHVNVTELLQATNAERAKDHLAALQLDTRLVKAAQAKGKNMFQENYWAHTAPDGKTPWYFIRSAGYNYDYAGENLARGFTDTSSVMAAWMASPGHRENILSPDYKDVGFAILSGKLTGDDTVLIVEEFGSRMSGTSDSVDATDQGITQVSPTPEVASAENSVPEGTLIGNAPTVSSKPLVKNIVLGILGVLLLLLILDIVIVHKRKVVRFVAHPTDHLVFFGMLLIAILIIGRGLVL